MAASEDITHIGDLKPDTRNARRHNPRNIGMIVDSLHEVGPGRSIVIDEDNNILAGNGTWEAAAQAGIEKVQIIERDPNAITAVRVRGLSKKAKKRLALFDNRTAELADWEPSVLQEDKDILDGLFTGQELEDLLAHATGDNSGNAEIARSTLAEQFGVPPFSVLDARQGYWQKRKRAWIALGIQSELGRGDAVPGGAGATSVYRGSRMGQPANSQYKGGSDAAPVGGGGLSDRLAPRNAANPPAENGVLVYDQYRASERGKATKSQGRQTALQRTGDSRAKVFGTEGNASAQTGTSIFDPVLCELVYRWFAPPDGAVLDPFAGGSVRGIVASTLGRAYVGIDLSPQQIEANEYQAQHITPDSPPVWIEGDAKDVQALAPGEYDILFSCPPYADLEVYSDDPRDLSTMAYADFLAAYRQIIAAGVGMLKDNRFACFVVGDVRDAKGLYRNFVSDTIAAFQDAGAHLYNEAILVTAVGSLPVRISKQFSVGRKLGKTHQNVLVFIKGDARKATEACGHIEVFVSDWLEGAEDV
jgi:DNA modification methylase